MKENRSNEILQLAEKAKGELAPDANFDSRYSAASAFRNSVDPNCSFEFWGEILEVFGIQRRKPAVNYDDFENLRTAFDSLEGRFEELVRPPSPTYAEFQNAAAWFEERLGEARADALAIEALNHVAGELGGGAEAAPKANTNDLTVVYSTIATLQARVDALEAELEDAATVARNFLDRIKRLEAESGAV